MTEILKQLYKMTKEEIIKQDILDNNSDSRFSMPMPFGYELLYKSMDQYAQRQSLLFHTWREENYTHYTDGFGEHPREMGKGSNPERWTLEELYEIFIEHQNKQL